MTILTGSSNFRFFTFVSVYGGLLIALSVLLFILQLVVTKMCFFLPFLLTYT